ncbi:DUF3556 domain-containing protein [Mycobacterium malmoense]|nr:DUF3556 domain-containing protein [Mycobacterium malmoense]UNB96664.1 DUF3556 domain-containing protein [Mycobacterium malmoense]
MCEEDGAPPRFGKGGPFSLPCTSLTGFNVGDDHLHNEDLIEAVRCQVAFEPGERVVARVEPEAVGGDERGASA